jgi:hypothetical protein
MLESYIRPDAPNPAFKTDDQLHYIIDNREKYLPESVEIALAELQHRGVEFSEEEITVINEDMQARRQLALTRDIGLFNSAYQNNLVDDPDAYIFYTRRVIRVFSILFGALFGSIMMAINIGKTKNAVGVASVVIFGLFFTTAQIVIGNSAKVGTSFTVLCSLIGAYCLDYFFWNRYIGNTALYKAKPYWIPLIIALVLVVLIMAAMIYGNAA